MRLLREVMKSPLLQVFKDGDLPFARMRLQNAALPWGRGWAWVRSFWPRAVTGRRLERRACWAVSEQRQLQHALQMGNDVLIASFLSGKRSPLFQRRCVDTHQRVIKLKSTDVVGWDVGCSQRLRNLSNNSTFICGRGKKINHCLNDTCQSHRSPGSRQLCAYTARSLSSQTPIRMDLCTKMCSVSQNRGLWATMIYCTFGFVAFFLL